MSSIIIDNATELRTSFKKNSCIQCLPGCIYFHTITGLFLTSGKTLLLKSKYKNYNFLTTRLFPNDTPVYKTNKSSLMSAHKHTHTQHICGQDYLSSPLNKAQHSKWKMCLVFTGLSGEVQDEGSLFKILSFTFKSKKPLSPSPESQIFLLIFENAC